MAAFGEQVEEAYRTYGPTVWRHALRQCRTREEADEVLQETFVVVARDYAAFEAARSPQAWLLGIARNLILSLRRKRATRRESHLAEEPWQDAPQPEDSRLDQMRLAVRTLPDSQRETLELRLVSDLSYAEIAEVQGIPIGTVRSRLHDAVRRLRETLLPSSAERR